MKIKVNDLKVGDKLRFPNGDVWEVCTIDSRGGMLSTSRVQRFFDANELASILSAVEVERKPEKVEFRAKVDASAYGDAGVLRQIDKDCVRHPQLAPFIGQTVKVEVTPE